MRTMSVNNAPTPAVGGVFQAEEARPSQSLWAMTWRRLRKNKLAFASLWIIVFMYLLAIFGPMLAPYDKAEMDWVNVLAPPSAVHWFGTDDLGRDIFTRVLYGARVSLSVGLVVVGIQLTIGILLGALAGYYGGWVDVVISRFIDIMLAMPVLMIAIIIAALFGPSLYKTMIVLGVTGWMGTARIVRGQFLSLKEREFIEGAKAFGARDFRIIFRHMLPNTMAPIIVIATLGIAGAILTESVLSFLGLGTQEPNASWGGILTSAQTITVLTRAQWFAFFPGLFIFITTLAINFLGDGLRDALDPRLKE